MSNVVHLDDFRPTIERPLSRGELERKVNRGKTTIFAWIAEGMPGVTHAPGGNSYRWSTIKRWLEQEKGWTFDDASSVDDGHISDPEEDSKNGSY